jgi:oligopeptide transport system substrate-binding protein
MPERSSRLALAAAVLIVCGTRGNAATIESGLATPQALTLSLDNAPATLDPLLSTETATQHILDDLFEGLVALGIDGQPVPGVASDWTVGTDGKTWTFHLRANARWSNGKPVTAADFIYAWRREVDPKTGAAYAQALAPIVNAPDIAMGRLPPTALGVESPDPLTLIVHLSGPVPYFLEILDQQYFYPLYEPAISQWGDAWTRPENLVSDGAFRLEENVQSSRITLAKNPLYWDAANVHLEHVTYLTVSDAGIQSLRYQAGEVQFTYSFAVSQYDWLKSQFSDQAVTAPYLGTFMLEFNMDMPPFKHNPLLRRALAMAVDRDALARYMKKGLNIPAVGLVPPLHDYHQAVPAWAALPDQARYEEARRLYHEAGYSAQHPLRMDLTAPSQGPDSRHVLEAVAAMWQQYLGAEIGIDQREHQVLLQEESLHKIPLYQFAWIGDYPDPLTFLELFSTGSDTNFEKYSNADFDTLMKAASQETDPAKRYQLLARAEQHLIDDAAIVPLFFYGSRHLIKPYVKGWQSNLVDRHPARFMYVLKH